ncbi:MULTISPECIES: lysozyme inhibitor LprI family protein [unclassified Lysobacter]|uniref:lysozyme inhibitor LprI family protein n=1 Tax=unclassified Lysobacter TaxID=2635362 RepID=UPI0009E8A370|nr:MULTISPECIES: lysozyme inhibitor LprI family protein [unclassified Lysobacter]
MAMARRRFRLRGLMSSALVFSLILGCASVPNSAYSASAEKAPKSASSEAGDDCFAIGGLGARESCFAKKSDDEIADCERIRPNACKPYKEMQALELQRTQLRQDILLKARSSYASYLEDDAAYLDDLAVYLKDSDAAWGAYRDADCLLEPFAQGMSRREAPDLTEACRVERTKARIAELKTLAAALK